MVAVGNVKLFVLKAFFNLIYEITVGNRPKPVYKAVPVDCLCVGSAFLLLFAKTS